MSETAPELRALPKSSSLMPVALLAIVGLVVLGGVLLDRAGYFQRDHRKMAPDVTFYARDGKPVHLTDYRGKVVLLNFWATWCAPCVAEAPSLAALSDELKRTLPDVVILAPALDDSGFKAIDPFVEKLHIETLAVVHDKKKEAFEFGTRKLPETWLISRDGEILERFVGEVDWAHPDIMKLLEKVAANQPETKT